MIKFNWFKKNMRRIVQSVQDRNEQIDIKLIEFGKVKKKKMIKW